MENLSIVIYRNNLRLDDNYPLYHAVYGGDKVLALYSLEILEGYSSYGFKKCGEFRRAFIYEALIDLKTNLKKIGVNLLVCNNIEKSLEALSKCYKIKIYFEEEVGTEESLFEKKLVKYESESFFSQTMIEPFYFDYNKSFSHFRKKAEKLEIKEPISIQKRASSIEWESLEIEALHIKYKNENSIVCKGGESEAFKRFNIYEEFIHSYKDTRNEMSGLNNSTKFSAYLSMGCISARRLYYRIKEYEKRTYKSKSSYWIYFELLWRDFFYLVMKNSGNRLFLKSALAKKSYEFRENKKLLESFFTGNSGCSLIDASIKELRSSGWLSNRNRQLVSNYFVKYLGLNWIYGAEFFETYLIDFNPASNYGNWAYQAGVGNDKQYRVFDMKKQSSFYNGASYIKKWQSLSRNRDDFFEMIEEVKREVYKL